jgi:hypothetical protein
MKNREELNRFKDQHKEEGVNNQMVSLKEALNYDPSHPNPMPSSKKAQRQRSAPATECVGLLDRPFLVADSWVQPADRGPSLREQVKIQNLRPLPENFDEIISVVADRLSTPGF